MKSIRYAALGALAGPIAAFLYLPVMVLASRVTGSALRLPEMATVLLLSAWWVLVRWWIPASVGAVLGSALFRMARRRTGLSRALLSLLLGAIAGVVVAVLVGRYGWLEVLGRRGAHALPNETKARFASTIPVAAYASLVAWLWTKLFCRKATEARDGPLLPREYRAVLRAREGSSPPPARAPVSSAWLPSLEAARAAGRSLEVAVAGGRASIEHRRTGLAASGPLLALGILFVAMVGCHRFVYFVATFPFSVLVIGWPLCTPLDIRNESGEALRVTPLGKRELSEKREPLPIEHLCVPPVFARQVGDLPLAPGGELRLSYDGDNVCVSDLVVRDARGDLWLMAGSRFQHDFVIRDPRTLPPLDPGLHDAFEQALRPAPHGWSAGPLRTMRALNPLLFVVAMAAFAAAFRLRRPRPLAEAPSAPGTHLAAPPPDR